MISDSLSEQKSMQSSDKLDFKWLDCDLQLLLFELLYSSPTCLWLSYLYMDIRTRKWLRFKFSLSRRSFDKTDNFIYLSNLLKWLIPSVHLFWFLC